MTFRQNEPIEPEIMEAFLEFFKFLGMTEEEAEEKLKNTTKSKLKEKIAEALDFFKAEAEKREQDRKLREIQEKIDKAQSDLKDLREVQKNLLRE